LRKADRPKADRSRISQSGLGKAVWQRRLRKKAVLARKSWQESVGKKIVAVIADCDYVTAIFAACMDGRSRQ
jgi:hypothetical protein